MYLEEDSIMTYRELLNNVRRTLSSSGIQAAQMEAFLLLEHTCGVDRTHYPLVSDTVCPSQKVREISALMDRRLKGEPIQYILGKWEFYGYDFLVGDGVLIPRPETELLVQTALDAVKNADCPIIADLCSGSGCIAVALKKERTDADIYAFELSDKAFTYLNKNAELNSADIHTVNADVLNPPKIDVKFDIIVSNPPYIRTDIIPTLEKEVLHEPAMALDGDIDGLLFYKKIPEIWSPFLKKGGTMAFEIGYDQGGDVSEILKTCGFSDVNVIQDLSGNDRICIGTFK